MAVDLLVVGLGYVGLPLAREATFCGMTTVGYDVHPGVVATLTAGRSHVGDIPDPDIAQMLSRGFRVTAEAAAIDAPDVVVICVPTPLSAEGAPDLSAVRAAVGVTGRLLPGMLVVLESTTYPGTTDEVVRPMLEEVFRADGRPGLLAGVLAGADRPGNQDFGLRNTPKIEVVDTLVRRCGHAVLRQAMRSHRPGQVRA